MSDFLTARRVKALETDFKRRGFKVEYSSPGSSRMIINPVSEGESNNLSVRFDNVEQAEWWLRGYVYSRLCGREGIDL